MLRLNEVLSRQAWRTLPFTADAQLTHRSIRTHAHIHTHTVTNPHSQLSEEEMEAENSNTAESELISSFNLNLIDLTAFFIFLNNSICYCSND